MFKTFRASSRASHMIERLACPVTGASAEVIFSRPYSLAELRPFAECASLAAQLADKRYEIRFSTASGLHFQTWVLDDSELAGLYSPPVDEKFFRTEIGNQKLVWFAHMTEEILVLRQIVPAKVPVELDFGCNWGKWASMALAFGSSCHGAGRSMSRHQATKQWSGRQLVDSLAVQGIIIRSPSYRGVAEDAPGAYKDVDAVADAAHSAQLSRKVAKLRPLACVKG